MRAVSDVIDELGFGMAQVRILIFAGGINWVNGTVFTCVETMPVSIALELSLHAYERAMLFTAAVVGKMLGNYSSLMGDKFLGRRKPILCGYFLAIFGICLSTVFWSIWPLALCWALSGFGAGFGGPAWFSLGSEASPADKRMFTCAVSCAFFSFAQFAVYAVQLSFYSSSFEFGSKWRELVLFLFIPSVLLFVAAIFPGFVESAHVLVAQNKRTEAQKTLDTMRRQNGRPNASIEFDMYHDGVAAPQLSLWDSLCCLFSRQLCCITMSVCLLTFTLNFAAYGAGYAMPIVLPTLDLGVTPGALMLATPFAEVLGYVSSTLLSNVISRRTLMHVFLCGSFLCFLMLGYGLSRLDNNMHDSVGKIMVVVCTIAWKFVMAHGWTSVYTYATEVFPTVCRSCGVGFVIGCGRLGSMSTSLTFEHLYLVTGTHLAFFGVICGLMVVDTALVVLALPETKGCKLEVFMDERKPLTK